MLFPGLRIRHNRVTVLVHRTENNKCQKTETKVRLAAFKIAKTKQKCDENISQNKNKQIYENNNNKKQNT